MCSRGHNYHNLQLSLYFFCYHIVSRGPLPPLFLFYYFFEQEFDFTTTKLRWSKIVNFLILFCNLVFKLYLNNFVHCLVSLQYQYNCCTDSGMNFIGLDLESCKPVLFSLVLLVLPCQLHKEDTVYRSELLQYD